jgi:interferon gamma-inducible protein 30
MVAVTDLKMVPYGNTKKNADGSFTCQHGSDECISDVYEMCTEYKLSGNISSISTGDRTYEAWPFIQCMELNDGNPAKAQGCFTSTVAKTSSLTWSDITDCYNKENSDVQNEGANATPQHDYVPWVLVDGTLLENTNLLLPTICKAYTGPTPASCSRYTAQVTNVCYNN